MRYIGLNNHPKQSDKCSQFGPALCLYFGSPPSSLSQPDTSSPPSPVGDDELMALYRLRLYTVHRLWSGPFFYVVESVLGIINKNLAVPAEGAYFAFNVLPGLVCAYLLSRKMPILDLLISFATLSLSTTGTLPRSSSTFLGPIIMPTYLLGIVLVLTPPAAALPPPKPSLFVEWSDTFRNGARGPHRPWPHFRGRNCSPHYNLTPPYVRSTLSRLSPTKTSSLPAKYSPSIRPLLSVSASNVMGILEYCPSLPLPGSSISIY